MRKKNSYRAEGREEGGERGGRGMRCKLVYSLSVVCISGNKESMTDKTYSFSSLAEDAARWAISMSSIVGSLTPLIRACRLPSASPNTHLPAQWAKRKGRKRRKNHVLTCSTMPMLNPKTSCLRTYIECINKTLPLGTHNHLQTSWSASLKWTFPTMQHTWEDICEKEGQDLLSWRYTQWDAGSLCVYCIWGQWGPCRSRGHPPSWQQCEAPWLHGGRARIIV